jgi:hypothetical protein
VRAVEVKITSKNDKKESDDKLNCELFQLDDRADNKIKYG